MLARTPLLGAAFLSHAPTAATSRRTYCSEFAFFRQIRAQPSPRQERGGAFLRQSNRLRTTGGGSLFRETPENASRAAAPSAGSRAFQNHLVSERPASRQTVARPQPNSLAIRRHDRPACRSAKTASLLIVVFGRPSRLPFALAAAMPERTRSRINSRSNSAMPLIPIPPIPMK